MSIPTDEDDTRSGSAVARSCAALQWRDEPPQEAGRYLCRRKLYGTEIVLRLVWEEGELVVDTRDDIKSVPSDWSRCQWAGPIPAEESERFKKPIVKWRVDYKDWRGYWNEHGTYGDEKRAREVYESQPEEGRRLVRVVEREIEREEEAES